MYGVEIIPQAIENAKRNAVKNGIENAEFFVGKSEEVLPEFYEKEAAAGRKAHADVIVVDPPRKGYYRCCKKWFSCTHWKTRANKGFHAKYSNWSVYEWNSFWTFFFYKCIT